MVICVLTYLKCLNISQLWKEEMSFQENKLSIFVEEPFVLILVKANLPPISHIMEELKPLSIMI